MKKSLFRSQILKQITLTTVILSLASGAFAAPPVAPDRAAGKDRTDAETRAMVLEKLKVGVNTDFTLSGSSTADKVLYEPAYFDAVAAAGFKSVRIFCGYSPNPGIYEKVIKDAIARDLVGPAQETGRHYGMGCVHLQHGSSRVDHLHQILP